MNPTRPSWLKVRDVRNEAVDQLKAQALVLSLRANARYILAYPGTGSTGTNAIGLGASWIAMLSKLGGLSLKLSDTIRYLSQPVIGFRNTDAVTAEALVAKS